MKENELMIGDFLRYKRNFPDTNLQGKIVKVCGVRGRVDVRTIDDGVFHESVHPDWLEPIPLTPEILEKNGFRETDMVVVGIRKMRWESEDGRTEITIWMDDTMPMEIRKNIYYEDEECYTLPFAWAVHKLQHALRLCQIEKEIEL